MPSTARTSPLAEPHDCASADPYTALVDLSDRSSLAQLTAMLDGAHFASPDATPAVISDAAAVLGWSARLYLVDYEQRVLVPLLNGDGQSAEREDVEATMAGRAFRTVEPV